MSSQRPRRNLWDALRGALGGTPRHAEAVLDTALVVSLADGPICQGRRDALLRLAERAEGGLPQDWDAVEGRIRALAEERPLFSAARESIRDRLGGKPAAETALRTAARVAWGKGALSETTLALFHAIAEELGILEPQRLLEMPAPEERAKLSYVRTFFNAPSDPPYPALSDAIQRTQDEGELRLLLLKLVSLRTILEVRFDGEADREVREVGLVHPTDVGPLRIDGELDVQGARYYVRVLADQEALHLGEAERLSSFSEALEPQDCLLLAHESPLCLADLALTQSLGTERMEVFALPTVRHPL